MAEEDKRVEREVVVDRDREPKGSNTALVVVLVVGVLLLLALLFGGFFGNGEEDTTNDNGTTDIEADVDVDGTETNGGDDGGDEFEEEDLE